MGGHYIIHTILLSQPRQNDPMNATLTTTDHRRDSAGLKYVYPVVSRRSGGVSLGINLNVNRACNWRCIYCQVPDLARGSAPAADLDQLATELRNFLRELLYGDFMAQQVPPEARRFNDIALSGDGEPTSAPNFDRVVAAIGDILTEFDLVGKIRFVLITNGSLIHRPAVQAGLKKLASLHGEVWFKLDRATPEGMFEINGSRQTLRKTAEKLRLCARLCPTWLQTCVFARDHQPPSPAEREAYLHFLRERMAEGVKLEGVLLYGLARAPLQPQAERLSAVPPAWLSAFSADIKALGLTVRAC